MSGHFTDRKVDIFIGAFGSGKTEISINYAMALAQAGHDVVFADMDVVTPYFRSREARYELEEQGIQVIAPPMGSDSPMVPAAVLQTLQSVGNKRMVLDVGGDKLGATAIGQFKPELPEGSYNFNFVINTYRPFTSTEEGILYAIDEIETVSRFKTTALINNANLGVEGTLQDILDGTPLIEKVAAKLDVPVRFVAMSDELAEQVQPGQFKQPIFKLDLFMIPLWRDGGYDGVSRRINKDGQYKAALKREYWAD